MSGIYIHIPFCKQACHYCNFHFSTSLSYKPRMMQAINREIELKAGSLSDQVSSIYFGGGTPSLLSDEEVNSIYEKLSQYFDLSSDLEITLEVNPDDVDKSFVQMIRNSPINRLSLGIQSFFEKDLSYMNRAHNSTEAIRALEMCLETGINNITADLIYGLPTLTHSNWVENISRLCSYDIPHLSCYQLTVEAKTPLAALISKGESLAPSDEYAVEQFYLLLDQMDANGYEAYEISNYAKPGYRSRHNSSYWQGEAYLGLGPSAHSFIGNKRSWNTVVNKRYMERIEEGEIPEVVEVLSARDKYNEHILTRLRTIEGIFRKEIFASFPEFGAHFDQSLKSPLEKEMVIDENGQITLTRLGKIWADGVTSDLMA